jgi:hypothetical protein
MENAITLNEVWPLVQRLSSIDKLRLIERIAPQLERELRTTRATPPPQPLRGMWQGLDITEEDIAEARQEMWGNFPRDDI